MRARGARWCAAAAAGLVFATTASCTVVLGIDADRYVAATSADAGAGADARPDPWGCVNAPSELDIATPVVLSLLVMNALYPSVSAGGIDGGSDLDTVSGTYLPGVGVMACQDLDTDCSSGLGPVVTNDGGVANFQLANDFYGFFSLSRADLLPATLYPGRLLTGQPAASFPAYDLTPAGFGALAQSVAPSAPISLDPNGTMGHVVVTIYDCQDHQGPGVQVSYSVSGATMTAYYFKGGFPSTTATTTDSFGLAGAVDVPIGSVTVSGVVASSGLAIGSATFLVRPGAITFAWIRVRTH